MPTWSPDVAHITLTDNPDGGFTMDLPLLADGAPAVTVHGSITGDGELSVRIVNLPGAIGVAGFTAWLQDGA